MAVLFAENPTLSLAPTLDQIKTVWPIFEVLGGLENLVDALVDVKIGRCDVREARAGDRRFTFAHRRYQETLFVRYLTQKPDHLSPRELLLDPRWREYTVTLLQTQPTPTILPLLVEATKHLTTFAKEQSPIRILPEFGGHLHYYSWESDPALDLLRLLQEGMRRRLADVPSSLGDAVESFLGPRWRDGDWHDRTMVLEVGALLPQELLQERLTIAVKKGSVDVQRAVFDQIVSLRRLSPDLTAWTLKRISDEVLFAHQQVDLLRLEALCSRLPDSVGASFVFHRSRKLRWVSFLISLMPRFMDRPIKAGQFMARSMIAQRGALRQIILAITLLYCHLFPIGLLGTTGFVILRTVPTIANCLMLVAAAVGMGVLLYYDVLYIYRRAGCRIDVLYILGSFRRLPKRLGSFKLSTLLVMVIAFSILTLLPGAVVHLLAHLSGWGESVNVFWYLAAGVISIFTTTIILFAVELVLDQKQKRKLRTFLAQPPTTVPLVFDAKSLGELRVWLRTEAERLLPTDDHLRSLARVLLCDRASLPVWILQKSLFEKEWDVASSRVLGIVDSLIFEMRQRRERQSVSKGKEDATQ